jgi:hypothetical protein
VLTFADSDVAYVSEPLLFAISTHERYSPPGSGAVVPTLAEQS